MSKKETTNRPTEAEMAILRVLWDEGPSTVREVHRLINAQKETAYTTVLRFMQIMLEKGLVSRDDSARAHIFTPLVEEEEVQGNMLGHLMKVAFRNSPGSLIMRALASKETSKEELDEVRRFLDDMEDKS